MTKKTELGYIADENTYLHDGLKELFGFEADDFQQMLKNIDNDFSIFTGTRIGKRLDSNQKAIVTMRKTIEGTNEELVRERQYHGEAMEEVGKLLQKLYGLAREAMLADDESKARELVGGTDADWIKWKLRNGYTLKPGEYDVVAEAINKQ